MVEEKVEAATLGDLLERPAATADVHVDTPGGTRRLTLRALPGDVYDELVKDHPPAPDAPKDMWGTPTLRWDEATFEPALVAACLLEPVLSEDDVRKVWKVWSKVDRLRLFETAYSLNEREAGVAAAGKGSAVTADTDD